MFNQVRELMKKTNLEALWVTDEKSISYLINEHFHCGERFIGLYIDLENKPKLVLNRLFFNESKEVDVVSYFDHQDVHKIIKDLTSAKRVGLDKNMRAEFVLSLLELDADFMNGSNCVDQLRAIKDETDINMMINASSLNDQIMNQIKEYLKPGVSEIDVRNKIHQLLNRGYRLSDVAVLYRTNAQSRTFEEAFMRDELPYKIVGGLKFYDRREVKDIIAYLKVLENPNDNISLKRIINTPRRGIGNATIDKVEQYGRKMAESIYASLFSIDSIDGLGPRAKNSLKSFVEMMNTLMAKKEIMGLKDFIEEVVNSIGYIQELTIENTIESKTRIENIKEFISVALNFEEKNEDPSLEEFLVTISLLSDVDKTTDETSLITLMTVHSAKGLEFPIVFLVGMEDGLFPIIRDFDDEDAIEEERRLCYVAITRAEEILYITNAQNRTIYGKTNHTLPSRFIDEMGDTIEKKIVEKIRKPEEDLFRVWDYTMPDNKPIIKQRNDSNPPL